MTIDDIIKDERERAEKLLWDDLAQVPAEGPECRQMEIDTVTRRLLQARAAGMRDALFLYRDELVGVTLERINALERIEPRRSARMSREEWEQKRRQTAVAGLEIIRGLQAAILRDEIERCIALAHELCHDYAAAARPVEQPLCSGPIPSSTGGGSNGT